MEDETWASIRQHVSELDALSQLQKDILARMKSSILKHNMHYKNGREAHNGDKVALFSYDGKSILAVGILYDAVAGNDYCNGKIAPIAPNDPMPNLKECLHLEDVGEIVPPEAEAPAAPETPATPA